MTEQTRTFDTGANRDSDEGKLDYESYLSPLVLQRYAEYMHKHNQMGDGTRREGDNWQKGMPLNVYMKSMWRHFMEVWKYHRSVNCFLIKSLEDALCGVLFNASGYLHEILVKKARPPAATRPTPR